MTKHYVAPQSEELKIVLSKNCLDVSGGGGGDEPGGDAPMRRFAPGN